MSNLAIHDANISEEIISQHEKMMLGGPGKTEYKFGMLVSVMSQLLAGDVGVIDVSDGMTARFRPE